MLAAAAAEVDPIPPNKDSLGFVLSGPDRAWGREAILVLMFGAGRMKCQRKFTTNKGERCCERLVVISLDKYMAREECRKKALLVAVQDRNIAAS